MRATASNLWRLKHCLYWARDDVQWTPQGESDAALEGTQFHALAEGREVPDASPRVRQLYRSYQRWCEETGEHAAEDLRRELVLAYNTATDTARLVRVAGQRDYSQRQASEFVGTFDVVCGTSVDDLKTGREENCHVEQLLLGALCVARRTDASSVTARFIFVRENHVYTQDHHFDSLDLDAFADQLRAWAAAIPTSEPSPGSHCRWCPAAQHCPATQQALDLVQAKAVVLPKRRLPLHVDQIEGPEHAAWAYRQLRAVKEVEASVWAALRQYADAHGGIDLGNGVTYAKRATTREMLDLSSPEALQVLKDCLGERWEKACSYETSKTAIQRAARGGPEPMAAVLRRVLEGLRAVGAVQTRESVTYSEEAADAAE